MFIGTPMLGATDTSHHAYSLYNTQVRIIHSGRAGIDYKLYIGLPRDYETKSASYPIVMVLDADYCFAMMHGISNYINLFSLQFYGGT